jgi:hypothetical protein
MEITFTKANKLYIANVPTGRIIISTVPGRGRMAVHRPTGKFSGGLVIVSAGKHKTIDDIKADAVREYDRMMGVDDIRRPVYV